MPNSFTKPVSANDILSALGGIAVDLGTSSGSANALAGASTVDTGTTFTSGRLYRIRANAANTGAATCSINGGTGVALKKPPSSTALASGDIANATELLLFFDGTNLQVLSGLTVSATDSTKVPLSTVTTKGDLITATGSGAVTRRAVGSANQFLAPNSGNSDGLEWRALTPSDMPYSQAGTTFTNDGNWYNFYSLAQGTHNGRFFISSALFAGFAILRISGTSIDLVTDDWGGFADITAASGKIAFRVSGGYLQINVGTGISSTPKKFSATFIGTVN